MDGQNADTSVPSYMNKLETWERLGHFLLLNETAFTICCKVYKKRLVFQPTYRITCYKMHEYRWIKHFFQCIKINQQKEHVSCTEESRLPTLVTVYHLKRKYDIGHPRRRDENMVWTIHSSIWQHTMSVKMCIRDSTHTHTQNSR